MNQLLKQCRPGLDFVHLEIIGWLLFAIAVMSCELPVFLLSHQ